MVVKVNRYKSTMYWVLIRIIPLHGHISLTISPVERHLQQHQNAVLTSKFNKKYTNLQKEKFLNTLEWHKLRLEKMERHPLFLTGL